MRGRLYAQIDCGSVAELPRNLRIWTRGGLYAKIDCRSVVGLPRNLQIWTRGGLYAEDRLRIRCDGAQMAIFGDFFASCVFSEPRAASFRHVA